MKSKFLIPTARKAFDFSQEAFAELAMRLRFEMLTPNDLRLLKAHGVLVLPDNTLSLEDAAWAREPYTKAVLYRLMKYRKDEQDAQAERLKAASACIEKPFKRIHLSEADMSACFVALSPTQLRLNERNAQMPATSTCIAPSQVASSLKRVDLESNNASCELITAHDVPKRRWIESVKEKVRALFGVSTTMRVWAE